MSQPLGPLRRVQPQTGGEVLRSNGSWSCLACGYRSDSLSSARNGNETVGTPRDGDFNLCFRCGEVGVFVNGPLGLAVREPTGEELVRFSRGDGPQHVRDLHRFWAQHGKP